ncbi:hypothetical protein DVH24_041484 [Malus domestica]|uniref:Uncharacterized protein n=1 Tax=Malus domestica TaxID=3750 RepID=A0A498IEE9_MALDO|nr:hypothetical protein DVH24_041484 [Malus domestica]
MEISAKHADWIQPNFKRKNQLHGCLKKFGSMICVEEPAKHDEINSHEAFWELTGFEFHWNSEVKRVARESNPMMGDPLGSSRMSSQKQNLRAWSGPKADNIVLRWWNGPGMWWTPGRDVTHNPPNP